MYRALPRRAGLWPSFVVLALASLSVVVRAQNPVPVATAAASPVADISANERLALLQTLLNRWAPTIQSTPRANVDGWRDRVSTLAMKADPADLRAALRGETYEAALGALSGHTVSSSDGASDGPLSTGATTAPRLGDLAADLTYTPVTPCRILDTRNTADGPIPATSSRSFVSVGMNSYDTQGGASTNCGTIGVYATAVAINLTAVAPTGNGFTTVYPYNTTMPLSASITYTPGAVLNNTVITRIPTLVQAFDFTIYTFAQSHYVGDIVGYFSPPIATPVQCINGTRTTAVVSPGSEIDMALAACPIGYTAVSALCHAVATMTISGPTFCGFYNNLLPNPVSIEGWAICCRVPGR